MDSDQHNKIQKGLNLSAPNEEDEESSVTSNERNSDIDRKEG